MQSVCLSVYVVDEFQKLYNKNRILGFNFKI